MLVTINFSNLESMILVRAGELSTPCVTIAITLSAPHSDNLSAANAKVPQVSAMSSTKMATFPCTFPTSTILDTSFAFLRSLWNRAKSTFSRSANEVALQMWREVWCQCQNGRNLL